MMKFLYTIKKAIDQLLPSEMIAITMSILILLLVFLANMNHRILMAAVLNHETRLNAIEGTVFNKASQ